MHNGISNDNVEYLMNGVELSVTNTEKDLGVMISDDLKLSNQCSKVIKTANKLVGFIGRTFEHKSENVILTLVTHSYAHFLNTYPRIAEKTLLN